MLLFIDCMYCTCERLEKTGSKLLFMLCAVLISKDQRTQNGGGIVIKVSNKRLDKKYEDTQGQLTEIL